MQLHYPIDVESLYMPQSLDSLNVVLLFRFLHEAMSGSCTEPEESVQDN